MKNLSDGEHQFFLEMGDKFSCVKNINILLTYWEVNIYLKYGIVHPL